MRVERFETGTFASNFQSNKIEANDCGGIERLFPDLALQDETCSDARSGRLRRSLFLAEVLDRRHVVPKARGHVLDIGYGRGANFALYKTRRLSSLTVLGSGTEEQFLPDLAAQYDLPLKFEQGSLLQAGFAEASFDFVVSTHFLCREKDPALMLSEIWRVLKPRGQLLFCEPGRHSNGFVARLQDWVSKFSLQIDGGVLVNRHMVRLIRQAGFHFDLLETGTRPFRSSVFDHLYCGVAVKPLSR